MKFLVAITFIFCFISEGLSQKSLSDYSFVVVPEKFDFVNEKDKYQLNSLTKFLFNKHGFNAYFVTELPDVRRCDGLYAEVDGRPAIIRTKVTVILKDCNGGEVYRSEVGKSKIKAYNKTYTAALRDAFLSIEALDVQQKEPTLIEAQKTEIETRNESLSEVKEENPKKGVTEITTKTEDAATNPKETISKLEEPTGSTFYIYNGATFALKGNKKGYSLFEKIDNGEKLKGTLLLQNDKTLQFVDTSGNSFPSHFDSEKNLIIDTSFQKMVFTKVSQ